MYLIILEVPVQGDSHGGGRAGDEDETGVLGHGHLLAHLLRPLPGVVLRLRGYPRLGVEREVHLADRAVALDENVQIRCVSGFLTWIRFQNQIQ